MSQDLNSYKQSITEINKVLDELNKKLLKVSESLSKFNKSSTPKGTANGIDKTNKKLTEFDKLQRKLKVSTEQLRLVQTKEYKQLILNRKELSNYGVELRNTKKTKKQLRAETTKLNKARVAEANRIEKNKIALQKFKKATIAANSATKKSHSSIGTFLKQMIQFQIVMKAVSTVTNAFVKSFQNLKALDSIRLQFETIVNDVRETAISMTFLTRISNAYGAELITLSNRYIKFRAASKQSNLSMVETQKIFESVTKAAGVLGLRTDELNGVFLALEQMISKGKVTTEELRRQLGERLPGAMGIMADAVGVTISQLDVMLKKGEIISAEVLPKFAIALEKAYGIENVKNVDTLQAATVRFDNTFTTLVVNMEGGTGRISKALITTIEIATKLVESFGNLFLSTDQMAEISKKQGFEQGFKNANKELDLMIGKTKELKEAARINIALQDKGKYLNDLKELKKELEEATNPSIKSAVVDALIPGGSILDSNRTVAQIEESIKSTSKLLGEQEGIVAGILKIRNKDLEVVTKTGEEISKQLRDKVKSIDGNTATGIIPKLKQQIKLTERLINLSNDPREIARLQNIINLKQEQIKDLRAGNNLQLEGMENIDAAMQDILDKIEKENNAIAYGEVLKKQAQEAELDRLDKLEAKRAKTIKTLEIINEFAQLGADIAIGLIERKVIAIEREKDAVDEKFENDILKAEELGTSEENIALRKKLLEEERAADQKKLDKKLVKEKIKQAKIDKGAALIQAGISTAMAIINAATIQPVYLAPAAVVLAAALGAAQIAAIAAQPIPKFKDGVEGFRGGLAVVGDGGRSEAAILPDGSVWKSPSKDTLVNLPKGTDIKPDFDKYMSESEQMKKMVYNAAILSSVSYSDAEKRFDKEMLAELKRNTKAVKKSKAIFKQNKAVDISHELFRYNAQNWT